MYQPVLIEVASAEAPLIDLDNTLFVQALVFALMAFLASKWLFKPYLRMREEREEAREDLRSRCGRRVKHAGGGCAKRSCLSMPG